MIEVRDLICEFPDGDGRVIRALDVPSFTLEDGGAMALIGPSGSGKTTLLHCLSGLMTPTKGTVIVSGADLTQMTRQEKCRFRAQKVGYVFQKSLILPYLTVAENIRLSARLAGWDLMQDELEGSLRASGFPAKETGVRSTFPAASSRGFPSCVPWQGIRRFFLLMNRHRDSTARTGKY